MAKENHSTQDSSLVGQRQIRLSKAAVLRKLGINPYPSRGSKTHSNNEIIINFVKLEGQVVSVTGRLMSWREHGQLAFGDLQDNSGKVQLYLKEEELSGINVESQTLGWGQLRLLDVGDHLQAEGVVVKTQRGEISVLVNRLKMLSKSIRPLPSKWHGITDKEERYRRRYLDMTMNPKVRHLFERRARFWQAIRQFLLDNDFIEINTPVLEHVTGGADAKPFITHYDALDQDFYLRISHELPLKRLIGGGYEKVFDIGPRFRNEGFSDEHLPEHIAMEWYWAYADSKDGMEFTKQMFRYVMKEVYGTLKFEIKDFLVDLDAEWEEIKFVDIIKGELGINVFSSTLEDMLDVLKKHGVDLGENVNRNRAVDNLWKIIRKDIAGPAFLTGVPKFLSPLAKSNEDNPILTDRFHPIIAGSELANAYSELNDPTDQLERFVEQQKLREEGDDEAQMLDIDYVEMLEYGMPPAVGFGLSERVFWFFENVSAKEGVPFPQLRSTFDAITLKIYSEIEDLLVSQESELRKGSHAAYTQLDLNTLPKLSNLAQISSKVINKLPGVKFGYIVLENVKVEKKNDLIENLRKSIVPKIREKYTDKGIIKNSLRIQGFRNVYKAFGVDPNSRLNSAEALIRRIVDGKGLYKVNSVVDTYNLVSVQLELPMAAYDLDEVEGQISLRLAEEGDEIIKIGDDKPTSIEPGELVYSDKQGVICLDFNYRDSNRTKITSRTKRIIVFADGHQDIPETQILEALSILGSTLINVTNGTVAGYGTSF